MVTMATECLSGSCFPTGGVKPLKEKEIDGVVVCILLSVIVGVLGRKGTVKGRYLV